MFLSASILTASAAGKLNYSPSKVASLLSHPSTLSTGPPLMFSFLVCTLVGPNTTSSLFFLCGQKYGVVVMSMFGTKYIVIVIFDEQSKDLLLICGHKYDVLVEWSDETGHYICSVSSNIT